MSIKQIEQDHGLDRHSTINCSSWLSRRLRKATPVQIELPIVNTNRTVGTILSHHVAKKIWFGDAAGRYDSHQVPGSAGQSFGAFLGQGITLELEGDANDYVGKGLSGGQADHLSAARKFASCRRKISWSAMSCSTEPPRGYAFFRGRAAERFCVRNSGAWAVIEGVGDHGCEYMTGGRVVILGPTGRNFAAGMSGGIAYVLAITKLSRLPLQSGDGRTGTSRTGPEHQRTVRIDRDAPRIHRFDRCRIAAGRIGPTAVDQFVKVMPIDYKRVLEEREQHDEEAEPPVHSVPENHDEY